MSLKFHSDVWHTMSDSFASDILASNIVFLSSPPSPSPVPRLPAYSPLVVSVYAPYIGKEAESTRFGLEERMTRSYASLDILSFRFGQPIKRPHPAAPSRVIHSPTRIHQNARTAPPTAVHQGPNAALVDFGAFWDAYKLVLAWVLVTLSFVAVVLARFLGDARSEIDELEELIDLYSKIDYNSTPGIFTGGSTSLPDTPITIRSEDPIALSDLLLNMGPSLVWSIFIGVYAESNSSLGAVDLEAEAAPAGDAKEAVHTPIQARSKEYGSVNSIIELYGDSSTPSSFIRLGSPTRDGFSSSPSPVNQAEDTVAALAEFTPATPRSSPSAYEEYSPRHKHQLKALIADVLARQWQGETLQIGDLRLEDYDDSGYSPPQGDESTLEDEVSPSPVQEDSSPTLLRRCFELPAWTPVIEINESRTDYIPTVDPTLIPLPAEDDELSSNFPTSDSLDVICDADHTLDNTTLGRVARDEAFAELCNEIGASFSSFDLSQRLGSAGNSSTPNFLQKSASLESGEDASINAEGGLSRSSLRDIGFPATTITGSSLLRPTISSITPSLFVSSPLEFDWTYSTLMRLHRRRLEIDFSLSVHLVEPSQPRRLMSHRMHSSAIYRMEAIGMLGQVLTEWLKDAARVVGSFYPAARDNGAKCEVSIRMVSRATRRHWDSDLEE
ncbi:hypothetical protein FRC11_006037 [Ceratobasidium sp. 423]|nr:hypothetical protein FRC11_006037 [Ceratobasidium sp. 423]